MTRSQNRPLGKAKTRPSRYDLLTPEEELNISGKSSKVILTGRLRSFKGRKSLKASFKKNLAKFEKSVASFADRDALIDAYVLACNSAKVTSQRAFESYHSNLKNGVLKYAKANGLASKKIKKWPKDLGHSVVAWLRKDALGRFGDLLSLNTARKYYGDFCSLFAEFAENQKLAALLPKLEAFPNNPFSGANQETERTKSIGLSSLVATLIAARLVHQENWAKFQYAKALFKKKPVKENRLAKGMGQFKNIDAVLWKLRTLFPVTFPKFTAIQKINYSLFLAINRYHGGWRNVASYFHPFAEDMVAPILLLTIYGHFNVEPLRIAKKKNLRETSFLKRKRVEVRTQIRIDKGRGTPYRRSFPIDSGDPCSPDSIFRFVKEWTKRIRPRAEKYADCIFIFLTNNNEVVAFNSAELNSQSGDSKWFHHLSSFCRTHGLPSFNLTELRQTSLDFAREISDDDIRLLLALKGGSAASVLDFFYKSDAYELRSQVRISYLQAQSERHIRTRGRVHHRGSTKQQDVSAATPGCECADPYDSPLIGETKGVLCGGLGRCPGCPLGSPILDSAYSFARLLQLRTALIEAKSTVSLERWLSVYKEPLRVLKEEWLPMYTNPQLWREVEKMTLPPIGALE